MNTASPTRMTIHSRIAWGILLTLGFYSLGEAVWSAYRSGSVQVISVGWNQTRREMVHWSAGWARFSGPLVLAWAFILWKGARRSIVPAALVTVAAFFLLLFSWWFTNLRLILAIIGFHVYIVAALIVGNKYGSFAALVMTGMLAIVGLWLSA